MADIHTLSGLTFDEHRWLTALLNDDWLEANRVEREIGCTEVDWPLHAEEIHHSMRAMVGDVSWAKLHTFEDAEAYSTGLLYWQWIANALATDIKPNLKMLRAFLKSEAWRQYIYWLLYRVDIDDAYDAEEEGAES